MRHINLTHDLIETLHLDRENKDTVVAVIVELLRECRGIRKQEEYDKILKEIRHRINKYLNFRKW